MFNKICFLCLGILISIILVSINSLHIGWSPLKALLDAGSGITCPSGNKAYIHPILGDLQPCSQSLNFYNKSSCPGKGIVCERFPILIPGFQDFCCWEDAITEEEELVIDEKTSSPDAEEELKETEEKTDLNEVLLPVILRPKTKKVKKISSSGKSSKGGTFKKTKKSKKTTTTLPPTTPSESEEEEVTTTTHVITTTIRQKPRRGLNCQNPEDSALIDFGNRLRDCYYQPCPRGYRCEISKELRRYICCGKEASLFLPPGMPPLPNPVPLIPRPFRPGGMNGGANGAPYFDDEEKKRAIGGGMNIMDNLRRSNIRQSPRKQKNSGKQDSNNGKNDGDLKQSNRNRLNEVTSQDDCSEDGHCGGDSSHLIDNSNPCTMDDCSPVIGTHELPCNNCYGPLTS
uniref:Uncharacterized protein n=1 Tax=Strongyloides papillosus TaxID=174720 RepID=A0A0N5BSB4_STREA